MKCFAIASTLMAACALTESLVAADGAEGAAWGYKTNDASMASPEQWAEHYPTCGGSSQSPIDISVTAGCNSDERSLTLSGECADFNLTQSDESFKASVNGGTLLICVLDLSLIGQSFNVWDVATIGSCAVSANDASYDMLQFHLHAPSEHTLNGKALDGEVHFVHSNTDGSALLVVGVFFEAVEGGETDAWVASVLDAMDTVSSNSTVPMSLASYSDLVNTAADAHGVYNYPGSLTTPACDEIVDWWVIKEPVQLSTTDFERLQSQLKELHVTDDGKNARPVQALNGRVISTFN
ncbi:hypothetical protein BBJ28_00025738 [Nothophytophthora sp. Chile5]|nr:hypothetical protein BBJ28_00025738 [Nothophytophthora sp. Chile5]